MNPAGETIGFLTQFVQAIGDGQTASLSCFGDYYLQELVALLL